jgi:hypothetical protein
MRGQYNEWNELGQGVDSKAHLLQSYKSEYRGARQGVVKAKVNTMLPDSNHALLVLPAIFAALAGICASRGWLTAMMLTLIAALPFFGQASETALLIQGGSQKTHLALIMLTAAEVFVFVLGLLRFQAFAILWIFFSLFFMFFPQLTANENLHVPEIARLLLADPMLVAICVAIAGVVAALVAVAWSTTPARAR